MNTGNSSGRDAVIHYLRRELIGPVGGDAETLIDNPIARYSLGALFPRGVEADEALSDEEIDERPGGESDQKLGPADDPVAMSAQFMPASLGLSFLLASSADTLTVEVSGARYERDDSGPVLQWRRIQLSSAETEPLRFNAPRGRAVQRKTTLGGSAEVVVVWRNTADGRLVTVSLVNAGTVGADSGRAVRAEHALFQVGVLVTPSNASVLAYPASSGFVEDDEDLEIALQYRRHRVFAVGHGTSVAWPEPTADTVPWIRVEHLPSFEVPNLVPTLREDSPALLMERLSDESSSEYVFRELSEFVDDYEAWARGLRQRDDVPEHLLGALERVRQRVADTIGRLRDGIEALRHPEIRTAFALANAAVLESLRRAEGLRDAGHARDSADADAVRDEAFRGTWRPFQLAFQLAVLPSLTDAEHPDRDKVDLLWFPTGGGKTEAYLGLSATAIALRRLLQSPAGTTVITRYTLRLLTAQQFLRTATLICALEVLRRGRPDELGTSPISLGLWVGRDTTPNTYAQAMERLEEMQELPSPRSPFLLEACPWCGTRLVPTRRSGDWADFGFKATGADFVIRCPTESCPFHARLPVQIVDEALYDHPPEFLVGTVDKFAQLAWREEPGRFLGAGGFPGPSLVIQDELHLLSGPLGTMVGLFEAAFQLVIEHTGARPKIIASTATIRRANDQARGLFGRDVALFPPPGPEYGDSYFARIDRQRAGRTYVGVMSPAHTPATALVHVCAVLGQAVVEIADQLSDEERDSYSTLVAYHNSLRELGKTVTFARDDIPARMRTIATSDENVRKFEYDSVIELTSNLEDEELTEYLGRLNRSPDEPGFVSFAACTNMLSVGVDVGRLALMVVDNQPKTTSEYIQATSRVGRSKVPGIVITKYSPARPRDRSHYESFPAYHQSLYRWVEPTSVTPFSLPARNRALHAAMVVAVRHTMGLSGEEDAGGFRSTDPRWHGIRAALLEAVARRDEDERDTAEEHLDRLAASWDAWATEFGSRLRYGRTNSKQFEMLLRNYDEKAGVGWPTPTSMRNVDRSSRLEVI